MSAWEPIAFGNGRNCDKLAFYAKNWLKSISTSNAPKASDLKGERSIRLPFWQRLHWNEDDITYPLLGWGHVILVNGYPVLTTFPWCGRQMDRGTDKWLPKFKLLGWIQNQILLATKLSSRRLAHPWSSANIYLNLKRKKWRSARSGGSRTRKILKYSSLKKFQVSRKRRQL